MIYILITIIALVVAWIAYRYTDLLTKNNLLMENYKNELEQELQKRTTALENQKKQLEDSEFRWKFAIEGSGDGLWDWNVKTNEVYFSSQWKKMLGFEDHEIQASLQEWEKRVHPDDLENVYKDITAHMEGKTKSYQNEHRVLCKDGNCKWILDRGIIVQRDKDGSALRFIGTHSDIDMLKQKEKELTDTKEHLESIYNSNASIIATITPDGVMNSINRYGETFTGYTQEEIASRPYFWFDKFIPGDIKPDIKLILNSMKDDNALISKKRNTWIDKDGKERMFEWSNSLILDNKGNVKYLSTIGIDITEQVQQDLKIKEQNIQLEKLNKNLQTQVNAKVNELRSQEQLLIQQSKIAMMGEMIGNIAHQWKQPLNALSINIQNLDDDFAEGCIDEKFISNFIEKNRQTINYMAHTIDDFRNFFKPNKAKVDFHLMEIIENSIKIIDVALRSNAINLQLQNNTNEAIKIFGYPNELMQVIINIINNAKDAIVLNKIKNGTITLKVDNNTQGKKVRICIIDNAGGVPEDIIDKVFIPYFTTKFESQGTGIGLYMSKTIIEVNMAGKLLVHNVDNGAEFCIELDYY